MNILLGLSMMLDLSFVVALSRDIPDSFQPLALRLIEGPRFSVTSPADVIARQRGLLLDGA
jgi:hypothetical protein